MAEFGDSTTQTAFQYQTLAEGMSGTLTSSEGRLDWVLSLSRAL